MKLKDFKRLITDGRVYDVVNNMFKPGLNGSERIVDKAQKNGWFYRTSDTAENKRFWCDMPTASEILTRTSDGFGGVTVTLLMPSGLFGSGVQAARSKQHTVTLKFYLEAGEEL